MKSKIYPWRIYIKQIHFNSFGAKIEFQISL